MSASPALPGNGTLITHINEGQGGKSAFCLNRGLFGICCDHLRGRGEPLRSPTGQVQDLSLHHETKGSLGFAAIISEVGANPCGRPPDRCKTCPYIMKPR